MATTVTTSSRYPGAGSAGPRSHAQGQATRPTGAGAGRARRSSAGATKAVDLEALAQISGRITALAEQKDPQRRSLFVDGDYALGLDLETVLRCGFTVGLQVSGPDLLKAHALEQRKRAWDSALGLLAVTARTRREVERRLTAKFPPAVVEATIEHLCNGGWLDDRAYAEGYIRSRREYGARRILADLGRKGIEREVAAAAVAAILGEVDATEQAREAAAKRLGRMGTVERPTAYRRLAGYLARRGFGPDVISRALAPLLEGLPAGAGRRGSGFGQRSNDDPVIDRPQSGLRRGSTLQRKRPGWASQRSRAEEEQE